MGPIFPLKYASQGEIHCLDAQATMVNNRSGNATPGWPLQMYYLQGGRFYVKEKHYRNKVHWSIGGKRVAQNKSKLWNKIGERLEGREDNRERTTVRGREREGLRERQAKVERRTAEYRRLQREEHERRIEEYAREK